MKKTILLVLFFCLCIVGTQAEEETFKIKAGADKFARIEYPADGNIELKEGTFELWFKIGFDPDRQPTIKWFSPMTYLFVGKPKEMTAINLQSQYSYREKLKKGNGTISGVMFKSIAGVLYEKLKDWKKGTWHLLAFTWKNEGTKCLVEIFVDGISRAKCEGETIEILALEDDSVIQIGSYFFNSCYATVDAMRISMVARTPEELQKSFTEGLIRDRFTLLLDNFDKIVVDKNKDSVTTITAEGQEGRIIGAYRVVDGKFGKALQLHVVEE